MPRLWINLLEKKFPIANPKGPNINQKPISELSTPILLYSKGKKPSIVNQIPTQLEEANIKLRNNGFANIERWFFTKLSKFNLWIC